MALPSIKPYDIPALTDLNPSRAQWQLDPSRSALLIHDMQNHFVRAFTADESPISTATANILRLRNICDELEIPVFYTAQKGDQIQLDRGLQRDIWGTGMTSENNSPAIIAPLTPGDNHHVLTKWRYSAFLRSNIEPMLHVRKRDQLIVCGIYAHIGCMLTVADAFMRDIQPFLVSDAVADFSREKHEMACNYIAGHAGVVSDTETVIGQLRTTAFTA